jgi:DNA polymerase-1
MSAASSTVESAPQAAPPIAARPVGPGDHVFLVDGSSFIFRAYFQSINQDQKYNQRPSDGLPTGAVRLFCTKLLQFIQDGAAGLRPTHLAIVFDKAETTFRNELYPEYKANRNEPPSDLVAQFPLMREAVRAFGLIPVEEAGYEADDLIAAYSCKVSAAGGQTLIVSPDKDLMQLVHDGVTFYDFEAGVPGKPGYRPERRLGRDGVVEKFGVPPEQVPDVQALIGDPTDNVPGVPGVGPKAAASLIGELGSLEAILDYRERPDDLDAILRARLGDLQREIDDLAGQPLKISSGAQVAEVLADKFGVADLPRDKKDKPTVDAETLERLGCDHPFCRTLIRARNLSRVIGATTRKVLENADQALVSKRLVTLDCNSPLAVPVEDLALNHLEPKRLVSFLKALELKHLAKRVGEAFDLNPAEVEPDPRLVPGGEAIRWTRDPVGAAAAAEAIPFFGEGGPAPSAGADPFADSPRPPPAPPALTPHRVAAARALEETARPFDLTQYETVTSLDRLEAVVEEARVQGPVAIDVAATGLDGRPCDLVGVALATAPGKACYVPLQHRGGGNLFEEGILPGQLPVADVLAALRPLLEDPATLKIGHNLKPDWIVLKREGIAAAPLEDVMLMSYVLDAGKNPHGLADLTRRHLGHDLTPQADVTGSGRGKVAFERVALDRATPFAAESADAALRLWRVLKPRLVAEGRVTVYETLERPLVPVLGRMEMHGIAVDRQVLSRLSGEFAQTLARLEAEIHEMAGETFQIGSPKQIGDILFGRLGLPGAKKTPSGQWATPATILEELAAQGHELPAKMLEWRQLSKLKSTYTDALQEAIDPATKRVHTSFSLAATTTGRLSSTDPNLQNIPIRTEMGRKIRNAFVAQPGHKIISADYSQIELRILAHMADIPQLKQAFADNIDIHSATASAMFGVPLAEMNPDLRRRAKTINFGIVYGISAFGLAVRLGIPQSEAAAFIKQYFRAFSRHPRLHPGAEAPVPRAGVS